MPIILPKEWKPDKGGSVHVSFSTLTNFIQCPRQVYYKKILGLPENNKMKKNKNLTRGKRIHDKIEKTLKSRVGTHHHNSTNKIDEYGQFVEQIILLDERLKLTNDYASAKFVGYCDYAVMSTDRVLHIRDWKTGSTSGNKIQLFIYALYFKQLLNPESIEARFIYLDRKNYEGTQYFIGDDQLQEAEDFIFDTCADIMESDFMPNRNSWYCQRNCSYVEECVGSMLLTNS